MRLEKKFSTASSEKIESILQTTFKKLEINNKKESFFEGKLKLYLRFKEGASLTFPAKLILKSIDSTNTLVVTLNLIKVFIMAMIVGISLGIIFYLVRGNFLAIGFGTCGAIAFYWVLKKTVAHGLERYMNDMVKNAT